MAAAFSKTRAAPSSSERFSPEEDRTALIRLPSGRRNDLGAGTVIAQAARADGGVDLVVRRGEARPAAAS